MTNYRGIANRLEREGGWGKQDLNLLDEALKATFKPRCQSADRSFAVCLAARPSVCPSICRKLIGTPECPGAISDGGERNEKAVCKVAKGDLGLLNKRS